VQIKKLKLPMKFGNLRGFAFVEYVTQQEAQNALTALSSTHLYGRHLVSEIKFWIRQIQFRESSTQPLVLGGIHIFKLDCK